MRVVLLSAIFGGHDRPKPLPNFHGFDDAVMITDNPDLSADGWTVKVEQTNGMSPRLASKLPKFHSFNYVDADVAVWLDGSFSIVREGFRDFCMDSLGDHDFVTWAHPDRGQRNCLYREAGYCKDWPKYADYPISEQVEHYRSEGMPQDFGLWACGTIVWRNNERSKQFGSLWLAENVRWSIQDQISLPYLVWKHRPNMGELKAHEYDNPWLKWHYHESEL